MNQNKNYIVLVALTYALLATNRSPLESGTFVTDPTKRPLSTVDFRPSSGSNRLGVWNVVSDTLHLNLGAPGGSRPTTLEGATIYTTR